MSVKDWILKKLIKFDQKLLNRAYEKESLSDELLEEQVRLNGIKYDSDINDSDEDFVQ